MATRTYNYQSAHDIGVQAIADYYANHGYQVTADHISAYTQPVLVGGRIPDIIVLKDGQYVMVEVETNANDDKDQHRDILAGCINHPNCYFYVVIVDSYGKIINTTQLK